LRLLGAALLARSIIAIENQRGRRDRNKGGDDYGAA
jgi:hypothetical protein